MVPQYLVSHTVGDTLITVHLVGLKLICHSFSHLSKALRSCCNRSLSLVLLIFLNKMVSSANNRVSE
jgi:hypothetical protein